MGGNVRHLISSLDYAGHLCDLSVLFAWIQYFIYALVTVCDVLQWFCEGSWGSLMVDNGSVVVQPRLMRFHTGSVSFHDCSVMVLYWFSEVLWGFCDGYWGSAMVVMILQGSLGYKRVLLWLCKGYVMIIDVLWWFCNGYSHSVMVLECSARFIDVLLGVHQGSVMVDSICIGHFIL